MEKVIVSVQEARRFAQDAFFVYGIPKEEALIFSDVLVESDMLGVMTHGLIRLPEYLERIKNGGMEKSLNLEVLHNWPWGGALDAGNGIGHVAAYMGMQWVIKKAKTLGIGMATMRMSTHFGLAAYYSLMATKQGMIGIVGSNSSPLMAPWGGIEKKIGNNPLAIAVPGKTFPISFDIACSAAARSKLDEALREEKSIPKGWALDEKGEETTDPLEAIKGVLQPFGGHKGYGLAFIIDIFSGILSSGKVSTDIKNKSHYSTARNIGHFFMAISIEHFLPLDEFLSRLEDYVNKIHNTETAKGVKKVRVPGEKSEERKIYSINNGITYHRSSIEILDGLANQLKIPSLDTL